MVASLVQSEGSGSPNSAPTHAVTLDDPPTPGNLVVAVLTIRSTTAAPTWPSGWTQPTAPEILTAGIGGGMVELRYRIAESGESDTLTITKNEGLYTYLTLTEFAGAGDFVDVFSDDVDGFDGDIGPAVALDDDTLAVGAYLVPGIDEVITLDSPWDELHQGQAGSGPTVSVAWYLADAGDVVIGGDSGTGIDGFAGIIVLFGEPGAPPPDPDPEPPPYVDPPPGRAILEIYVADAGSPRWDVAVWDGATWGGSSWQDITHLGITAEISWGAREAERGILADVEPGVWQVDTHDPDRQLDPANVDGPWYTDLVPGLPIRLSTDGGFIIRTGVVSTITYEHEIEGGRITATDRLSIAANARVPSDQTLANTLRARARDAIEAAGIVLAVEATPAGGDPALAPHEADQDLSVWEWIKLAAREVHHVPYLSRHETLRFRPWDAPRDRGMVIGSPELINLTSHVSDDGLISVVRVNDVDDGMIERRITPTPRYGQRVHTCNEPTIDGDAYADAILVDRGAAALRWRPGAVRPLTSASLADVASIEPAERVRIDYPEKDVDVDTIILYTRVRVVDLSERAGCDWRFIFAGATASVGPLVADAITPYDPLTDDDDGELLYPDGVVGLEG